MEKWSILGLDQEKYKIRLEHLVVTESNTVLKKKKRRREVCQKDKGDNLKEVPMAKVVWIIIQRIKQIPMSSH